MYVHALVYVYVHTCVFVRFLGLIGMVWFLLSIPLNILRIYSLKLLSEDTYYYYLSSHSKEELIDIYNENT